MRAGSLQRVATVAGAITLAATFAGRAQSRTETGCSLTPKQVNFHYVGSVRTGDTWGFAFEFSLAPGWGPYEVDWIGLSGFAKEGYSFLVDDSRTASVYRIYTEAASFNPSAANVERLRFSHCTFSTSVHRMKLLAANIGAGGDSFASGEANPPFANEPCHRTTVKAWPAFLSAGYAVFNANNVACSGSKIADLFRKYRGQPSQLEQMERIAAEKRISVVLLSIGGNDVGFGDVIYDCWRPRHNCATDGTLARAEKKIAQLHDKLVKAYNQWNERLRPIFLMPVKYPHLFPASGTYRCSWLAADEQRRLNEDTDKLNAVIDSAAADTYSDAVITIDITNALKGHELCTKDSWVSPIGRLPKEYDGHPKVLGQEAIADAVRQALVDAPGYGVTWP